MIREREREGNNKHYTHIRENSRPTIPDQRVREEEKKAHFLEGKGNQEEKKLEDSGMRNSNEEIPSASRHRCGVVFQEDGGIMGRGCDTRHVRRGTFER